MSNVIINGVTYNSVPYVSIPTSTGGTASFYDTSSDTASPEDVRQGKKYHGANGDATGSLTEVADTTLTISEKDQSVTIPAGIHSGNGKVSLSQTAKNQIVSSNIKSGSTIMGVSGDPMVKDTTIPSATAAGSAQIAKGFKGWVNGALIDGNLTAATVSQDSSTKVLTIS